MNPRYVFGALAFVAAVPALAGTIATSTATPQVHRMARADATVTRSTSAGTGQSAIASDSVKQKNTPTAAAGGLLNTDATPAQARAITKDTNRKIAHGDPDAASAR